MYPMRYESWGRYPTAKHEAIKLRWRDEKLPVPDTAERSALPYGNGRSYGDVCLNDGGLLLDCRGLNRLIAFDSDKGTFQCEAGALLSDILALSVPQGWFLPVTPGTQFVTVGGAIANDVHGKNHQREGTFGCHVSQFELLRTDGTRLLCSPQQNADWYAATIGGLGLTGVILWAEIQLKSVYSPMLDQETVQFGNLGEFLVLSDESDSQFEYTAGWVDCLGRGGNLGRGLFIRANHGNSDTGRPPKASQRSMSVPFVSPMALVNVWSIRLFNSLYFRAHSIRRKPKQRHYSDFLYPLDRIHHWNRIYGRRGFMQYQCVIPRQNAADAIAELLLLISSARTGSFFSVIKMFGDRASPGYLSFPKPGATLALDFPNQGASTLQLLDELDAVTRQAGGAVYAAKDSRMSAESFQAYYPQWRRLIPFIDPRLSSSFWRRVTTDIE
jgi:FAD/FMN-containing dehydrogenase